MNDTMIRIRPLPPPGPWVERGACLDMDPSIFVIDKHETRYDEVQRLEAKAKAVCARCPVIDDCQDYARRHMPDGVWAGETAADRRRATRRSIDVGARVTRCVTCLGTVAASGWCPTCGGRVTPAR